LYSLYTDIPTAEIIIQTQWSPHVGLDHKCINLVAWQNG